MLRLASDLRRMADDAAPVSSLRPVGAGTGAACRVAALARGGSRSTGFWLLGRSLLLSRARRE